MNKYYSQEIVVLVWLEKLSLNFRNYGHASLKIKAPQKAYTHVNWYQDEFQDPIFESSFPLLAILPGQMHNSYEDELFYQLASRTEKEQENFLKQAENPQKAEQIIKHHKKIKFEQASYLTAVKSIRKNNELSSRQREMLIQGERIKFQNKIKNIAEGQDLKSKTQRFPDIKIHLPVKNSYRLEDGKKMNHGLDLAGIIKWYKKFTSKQRIHWYLSPTNSCVGTVLQALRAGGAHKFLTLPLLAIPSHLARYAEKLEQKMARLNGGHVVLKELPKLSKYLPSEALLSVASNICKKPNLYEERQYKPARCLYEYFTLPITTAYKFAGSFELEKDFRKLLNKMEGLITRYRSGMKRKDIRQIYKELESDFRTLSRSKGIRKTFGKLCLMTFGYPVKRKKFKVQSFFYYPLHQYS